VKGIDVQKIVDRVRDECFEAHRGAFWWDEGRRIAVAFGNDGHDGDGRARLEVEALRKFLHNLGGQELGFATAGDGYSWAHAWKPCSPPTWPTPSAAYRATLRVQSWSATAC
jgi:hypothetical protein